MLVCACDIVLVVKLMNDSSETQANNFAPRLADLLSANHFADRDVRGVSNNSRPHLDLQ